MAMRISQSVVLVVIAVLYPDIAQACSCGQLVTLQEYYCRSDQVMRIFVQEEEVWVFPPKKSIPAHKATDDELANHNMFQGIMYWRYEYTSRRVYKGDKPRTRYAFTLYHDNLCGGSLEIGQEMIVMGYLGTFQKKTAFVFSSCDFVVLSDSLSIGDLKRVRQGTFKC